MEFDQSEFASYLISMDKIGYLYVPTECKDKRTVCKLHIALHGCAQGTQFISDTYAVHSEYNGLAEANKIIILYPQACNSTINPEGCWDWWGFTGADYASKLGPQVIAIKRMIDRIATPRGGTIKDYL
jgi:poly(3-hydroxybutyrate) depolymerase